MNYSGLLIIITLLTAGIATHIWFSVDGQEL